MKVKMTNLFQKNFFPKFYLWTSFLMLFSLGAIWNGTLEANDKSYGCDVELKEIMCRKLSDQDIEIFQKRNMSLYQTLEECQKSCENLFSESNENIFFQNHPAIYRIIHEDEIRQLEKFGHLSWSENGRNSYVHKWVAYGSGNKKAKLKLARAQYSSFFGDWQTMRDKSGKYNKVEKITSSENSTIQQTKDRNLPLKLNIAKLRVWAKANGKSVRLPQIDDLEVGFENKYKKDTFPLIKVPIEKDTIIFIPVCSGDFQNFFFPVKSFSLRNPRSFSHADKEVLMVTSRLPLDVFDLAEGSDQHQQVLFEQLQQISQKKNVRIVAKVAASATANSRSGNNQVDISNFLDTISIRKDRLQPTPDLCKDDAAELEQPENHKKRKKDQLEVGEFKEDDISMPIHAPKRIPTNNDKNDEKKMISTSFTRQD